MAQADDIRAAQQQTRDLITGVQQSIDKLQGDMQTLIDRLGQVPGIPDDILTNANEINDGLKAMKADVDASPQVP